MTPVVIDDGAAVRSPSQESARQRLGTRSAAAPAG